jgi:mxaJ protein
MSSIYSVCSAALLAACVANAAPAEPLRVCADPNNLPFSNVRGEGFENALAQLVAHELGRSVAYTWWPQRRGFLKNTLRADRCDVVIGMPLGSERVALTRPYYRSGYVFVTRAGAHPPQSFDDPALADARIGLHAIGDDYANVPPAAALARRGLVGHVTGYPIYGDYSQPNPPLGLIDALANGDIDVAIAWGPLAGYAAKRARVPLRVTPVPAAEPGMTFAIAMAVRPDDKALVAALDRVLAHDQRAIARVLDRFGIPQLPLPEATR